MTARWSYIAPPDVRRAVVEGKSAPPAGLHLRASWASAWATRTAVAAFAVATVLTYAGDHIGTARAHLTVISTDSGPAVVEEEGTP